MDIKAVLFDMDGTIVSTEPVWHAVERELVAEHGGTWTDEQAAATTGSDLLDAAEALRSAGVNLPARELVAEMEARVTAHINGDDPPPWRPGALELLAECRERGVRTALVTMAWRTTATAVVSRLPWGFDSFDLFLTGDQVERGKPHPDPYVAAYTQLGCSPDQCVAVEDSPTGAASAAAAGVRCVAVPMAVPVPPIPGRVVVSSLEGVTLDWLAAIPHPAR